jgi:anti-sigma B factor antagonist
MFSVDLSIRECDGYVVAALRGELDIADAARIAVALVAVAARQPRVIVDLAGLEFLDSSGVAALAHGRKHAWDAGGDLLLAAPQPRVLRVLTITHLIDGFCLYASVAEAAAAPERSQLAAAPIQKRRVARMRWPRVAALRSARHIPGAEHGNPRKHAERAGT